MYEALSKEPEMLLSMMALLIPIVGIVFWTLTSYFKRTREAELDASLKHEMLQCGMSADEIVRVINAGKGKCDTLREDLKETTSQKD